MNEIDPIFGQILEPFEPETFVCEHEEVVSEVYEVPTGGGMYEPKLMPRTFYKCLLCEQEWSE